MKLQNLTKRERWVLVGAGIVLIMVILFLTVDSIVRSYKGMEGSIQANRDELQKMFHLRGQYQSIHRQLETIKSKLDKKETGFSLLSFLSDLANQQNIRENIGSFKPKTIQLNEVYNESSIEVLIDNITLWQLIQYIYKIENSGHVLKVKRLRIKARYDNPDLLSVTFQVSTYEKAQKS